VIRRLAMVIAVVAALAATGRAQFEWDKPKANTPVPNPSTIRVNREQAIALVKSVLERKAFALKGENCADARGDCVLVTESMVFTRGIVADTQFNHFADLGASEVRGISRGRVAIRVEVSPSSPTQSLVAVYGAFEGLTQEAVGSKWISSPSRGILEDEILRCIVARSEDRDCESMPGDEDSGGEPTEDAPPPTGGGTKTPGEQKPPRD
jgi:hypothetical protein